MRWSVRNRYFVSLVALGVLAVAVSYGVTRLPFQLFGKPDIGQFFVNIEASNTYSLEDTELLAKRNGSNYIQLIIDLQKRAPEGVIARFITGVSVQPEQARSGTGVESTAIGRCSAHRFSGSGSGSGNLGG